MKMSQGSPQATARSAQRPPFLYSCGVSALTVARSAYKRVEDVHGPMGTLARSMASWVAPVLRPVERRWLSLLYFADGHIQAVEDAVASVFPPATHLFGILDELALLSEALPKKFDDAADHLLAVILRLPFLGWACAALGGGLRLLASAWDDGRAGGEREICVDAACHDHPGAVGEDGDVLQAERRGAVELRSFDDLRGLEHDVRRVRCMQERIREMRDACKVIMDKYEGRGAAEEGIVEEEEDQPPVGGAAEDKAGEGAPQQESEWPVADPILKLFDERWHTSPRRRR